CDVDLMKTPLAWSYMRRSELLSTPRMFPFSKGRTSWFMFWLPLRDGVNVARPERGGGSDPEIQKADKPRLRGQLATEGGASDTGDSDQQSFAGERLLVRPEGQVDGVADLKAANLSVQLKILNALFPAQLLDVFDFQGVSPQVNTVSQAS